MLTILHNDDITTISYPLYLSNIPAGFPSPADDYIEQELNLDKYLIKHPAATFFLRVDGESMIGSGIHNGDLLIVDKSLEPRNGTVVIASIDGDLTVKKFMKQGRTVTLMPDNPNYKPITISGDASLEIWGVVTAAIHKL